jgi:anthranilate synthase component 1
LDLPRSALPLAHLSRIPCGIIIDHRTGQTTLIAEAEFADRLDEMQADLKTVFDVLPMDKPEPLLEKAAPKMQSQSEEPEDKYLLGVQAIKEYILAGDVFQVNLSRQWTINLAPDTSYLAVYQALRQNNPAPFAALVCLTDAKNQPWQIISSSPERLVKYQAQWVDTRHIAGTRKRSLDAQADLDLMAELISHPKERAEHIMLIDLERNDLGRICLPGTVQVNELMVVETYQHVHHIVSNVRGKPQEGLTPLDIVHALFPGGTITGCPKIRCMQIIAELEQMPRDAYTGSLGYINRDGSMDLNILIRTMMTRQSDEALVVQFRAGAGIVADSHADSELTETRHKAKGLVNALSAHNSL